MDRSSPLEVPQDGSDGSDGSDNNEVGVVYRVYLLEGSLGKRGPGTAAPTVWEAIRGLEEALDVLDRQQARTDGEVASLEADTAPKSYVRDTVRTRLADVARPLLDRVKQLEGRLQTAQGSAGRAVLGYILRT